MQPTRALQIAVLTAILTVLTLLSCGITETGPAGNAAGQEPTVGTFSICAYDPATGALGVAVTSRVPHVGRVVPHVKPGVGAVATQASARVAYGPELLALLEAGKEPGEAINETTTKDARRAVRQLGVVDAHGHAASFTGQECQPYAGARGGKNYTVQGNLLVGPEVLDAVAREFERTEGSNMPLAERLIRALLAGQRAGGDKRKGNRQSAALLVAVPDRPFWTGSNITVDIRIAEHPTPVLELRRQYETIRRELGYRAFRLVRGRDVRQLKRMLHKLGYWRKDQPLREALAAGGQDAYDRETAEAVDRFRRDHGLPTAADGLGYEPGIVDRPFVELLKAHYYGFAACGRCGAGEGRASP